MTKPEWERKISKACRTAGTYKACFKPVIESLASIMARRDAAQDAFDESGEPLIVTKKLKSGAVVHEENPLLSMVADCDKSALAFWRELGLTPAGMKRLTAVSFEEPEKTPKADATTVTPLELIRGKRAREA